MKPFTFRLEVVRTLRESERKEALEAYGAAIVHRRQVEEQCQLAAEALQAIQKRMAELRESVFPASLQPHFFDAMQLAETRLQELFRELSEAEQQEAQTLDNFLEAKARVDILDRLKDKRREAHFKAEYRREEKEIEDLVSSRHEPGLFAI